MRFLTIAIIFLATAVSAQSLQYKVHTVVNTISKDTYAFPIFSSATDPVIADSVNTDIVRDFLEGDVHKNLDSLFVNVWATQEERMPRLTLYGFTILQNSNGVLSIGFNGEGCGAYCEEFTNHYNYDLRTGKRIFLKSLFTNAGIKQLAATLTKVKTDRIQKQLHRLKRDLKAQKSKKRPDSFELERDNEAIELYQDCIERGELAEEDFGEYFDFYLTKTTFTVILGRCSAHVNRAVDDLGNFEFSFNSKDWSQYFSPYGKVLFGVK